jgi:alpha-glucosidase
MFDFGYDVADYCAVDPLFGSLADVDELLAKAHARGMRVILDLVPNHTSHLHPWFKSARRSRTDPKRRWYTWRDPAPGGGLPNNWISPFGGPTWTFDQATQQYYLHSFLPEQPDLDYRNPEVADAMEGVLRFWLDRGVDGFRVDVVHKLVKDAELRDNPDPDPDDVHPVRDYGGQRHVYDEDRPEVHDVLRRWRRVLDEYGDRTMVGEVYLLNPERVARYHGEHGDELPLAFNFSFLWCPWDARAFRAQVDRMEALLPPGAQPTYVLSSHDAPRYRSRFDDPVWGERRARVAAMMLLTLRGTPFLYYGEEIGMADVAIPAERVRDPVGKRFPLLGRDPERTPMQWDAGRNAGFTTAGEPWLPIAPDATTLNVAAQRDDARSHLSLYRRLLRFRKGSLALRCGAYQPLDGPEGTFVYVRTEGRERVLVVLNFASEPRDVASPVLAGGRVAMSTDPDRAAGALNADTLSLGPVEGVIVAFR